MKTLNDSIHFAREPYLSQLPRLPKVPFRACSDSLKIGYLAYFRGPNKLFSLFLEVCSDSNARIASYSNSIE